MMSDSTVVPLRQPDAVDDPLTAILRSGARRLLAEARERLVRHGHGPERLVQTGIGPVAVQRVRLRDRGAGENGERIRFTSAILPRWARLAKGSVRRSRMEWQDEGRRTRSLDALLPILYLRGVSMGDF